MFAMYKTSSLISTASRRFFHSTSKSFKSAVEGTTTSAKATATENVVVKPPAAAAEAASSTSKGGIMAFPKTHPFAFQLMVATAKTSAADLVCQTVAERKKWNEIDWRRNGIFVVFGFVYLGGFQYWLMVTKYRQWFPTMDRFAKLPFADKLKDTAGILDAMKMVIFDVTLHLPVLYFPSYYTVKELVGGHSWNPMDWVKDGVTKYSNNLKEDLTAMIKLWGPSDCVQFVLPVHIRMPFRHLVSFFWTAYVSFTRGAIDNKGEDATEEKASVASLVVDAEDTVGNTAKA